MTVLAVLAVLTLVLIVVGLFVKGLLVLALAGGLLFLVLVVFGSIARHPREDE